MKKAILISLVALVLVLGGLAAAWYWAGPWLAQEYIDWQYPDWDVLYVERYEKMEAVVVIIAFPDRDFEEAETEALLSTIGTVARLVRFPGYDTIGILFVIKGDSGYPMYVEIVAPMEKTDWHSALDCQVSPLWFWGAMLKPEYVLWPD